MPSATNLRLMSASIPSMINHKEIRRLISQKMDLFIEFKIADTSDPFSDPEDPLKPKEGDFCFENDLDNARLVRGQLASYAAAHAGCQFRVHIFCVLVCGKYARFIRWDCDGATVTQRFDYIKEP